MRKIGSLPTIAGALLAFGLSAAPAHALRDATWVSGHGTDSGTCAPAAPCRTFAFALTQTAAGGEIGVLDPARYGTVTITKAISIVNDGVGVASIGASSGNGVTVTAGASDSVHLRGLTIEGLGTGANGIQFNSGGNLAIENCVVRNFGFGNGIDIAPSTSGSFSVSTTIASNNGVGILVQPPRSAVVARVLSKVTANNNNIGILVNGGATAGASLNVTIVDSVASNNTTGGVAAQSTTGTATALMVRNVVAGYNFFGLQAVQNAILRVAHSVITGNGTGVTTFSGGILDSYGDNDIDGNANNNTGVLTVIPTH